MHKAEAITAIVLAAHALARIAAHDAGNDAPSAQWRTLSILEQQGGLRLGALASATRTTQPGMTRLIGALEHAGFVERTADPDDSRAIVVTATEAGIRALDDWRTELGATLAPRFDRLGDDDWRAIERTAAILGERAQSTPDHTTGAQE
ncbi:MarR family transcriptional regulator [Microbacterium sp.]|uniref:MarR family winged helix-turn-helix transcriptional regulator n=1 Tax=Microbacterium sp. TaxID=51671 RepID=UPI0028B02490|nr:MarR family transcriptional regulator [Microbacterium sp.]